MSNLQEKCKKLMAWWEKAQYWEGFPGHNVFDYEDEILFEDIKQELRRLDNEPEQNK